MAAKRARKIAVIGLVSACLVFSGWRVYRSFVPEGLAGGEIRPYVDGSYDRGEFVSPDGRHRLLVRSNDPGVRRWRDDLCFTWVVEEKALWGKRVVASGYLPWTADPPAKEQIPLAWNDNNTFTITFVPDPMTGTPGGERRVKLE